MIAAAPFRLSTIGQISIAVRDIARSVEFYRDRLQIPLLFQSPDAAFFDCAGVQLMLAAMKEEKSSSVTVYFTVPDIHNATDALKARGVRFDRDPHLVAKMPDHELWFAFFRDPDENALALLSRQRFST